ncbi:cupin domain-containing protein [Candidatus Woesearchaeota archaeon]|nr:cupin domain-containing protein [Candidatus Woesearchaeota archaeon]
MKTNYDLQKMISYSDGGIISKVVMASDKLNITLFSMAANTGINEHTSTKAGTVYIIEGEGVFLLAHEPIIMKPGILIQMKPHQPHSISAKKDTSFLLTLIH